MNTGISEAQAPDRWLMVRVSAKSKQGNGSKKSNHSDDNCVSQFAHIDLPPVLTSVEMFGTSWEGCLFKLHRFPAKDIKKKGGLYVKNRKVMPKQMASTNCTGRMCILKSGRDIGWEAGDRIEGPLGLSLLYIPHCLAQRI